MKSVFLSHASQDKDTVRQIAYDLSEGGLNVWFDENELNAGDILIDKIASVLQEVDIFCIVLTSTSITKSWVRTEISIALASEIDHGRPQVIGLLLQDCEVPVALRHKLYIDFRGQYNTAIEKLRNQITGIDSEPSITKQAVIASIIRNADDELWARLTCGATDEDRWSCSEFADIVQTLTPRELEGVVAIGSRWSGKEYKWWESDLLAVLKKSADGSAPLARSLLRGLVSKGFLEPATDLDYQRRTEVALCDTSALWLMRRIARRSGIFPTLPPPLPERLSAVLADERAMLIIGQEWYATRFSKPTKTAVSSSTLAIVAVVRHNPPTTWIFQSENDRQPLSVRKHYSTTELTSDDPLATLCGTEETLLGIGFGLTVFDDLKILTD